MTYFLNEPMSLDPGPASGLTGGIRTRAEGFWARWGLASRDGYRDDEDHRARETVIHDLAEQVRPRLSSEPSTTLFGIIPRTGYDNDVQAILAAREEAGNNPDAWGDIDISPEWVEAETNRRLAAEYEALQMDAALAPAGSWLSDLAAGMGAIKQSTGSYQLALWLFASLGVLAWFGLHGVKRRWRTTWGSAAVTAARV